MRSVQTAARRRAERSIKSVRATGRAAFLDFKIAQVFSVVKRQTQTTWTNGGGAKTPTDPPHQREWAHLQTINLKTWPLSEHFNIVFSPRGSKQ